MKHALLIIGALAPLVATGVILSWPNSTGKPLPPTASGIPNPSASTSPNVANSPSTTSQAAPPAASSGASSATTPGGPSTAGPTAGRSAVLSPPAPAQSATAQNPAQQLAGVTGRRVVAASEFSNHPVLQYVGFFINRPDNRLPKGRYKYEPGDVVVGSGTIIRDSGKRRYILTAGHVAEAIVHRAPASGTPLFVLRTGEWGKVVDEVVDGGWKYKLVSFDIAVCAAEGDFSIYSAGEAPIEYTSVEPGNCKYFGQSLHISGFDLDLWLEGGSNGEFVLVDRSGVVKELHEYRGAFTDKAFDALDKFYTVNPASVTATLSAKASLEHKLRKSVTGNVDVEYKDERDILKGVGLLFLAGSYLVGAEADKFGWSSMCIGSSGIDGGPVWTDDGVVIGVAGAPFGNPQPALGLVLGYLAGSRLTEGASEAMFNEFMK